MTITQRWRNKRNNEAAYEAGSSGKNRSIQGVDEGQSSKRPIKQRLFPPLPTVNEKEVTDSKVVEFNDMETNEFDLGSEPEL